MSRLLSRQYTPPLRKTSEYRSITNNMSQVRLKRKRGEPCGIHPEVTDLCNKCNTALCCCRLNLYECARCAVVYCGTCDTSYRCRRCSVRHCNMCSEFLSTKQRTTVDSFFCHTHPYFADFEPFLEYLDREHKEAVRSALDAVTNCQFPRYIIDQLILPYVHISSRTRPTPGVPTPSFDSENQFSLSHAAKANRPNMSATMSFDMGTQIILEQETVNVYFDTSWEFKLSYRLQPSAIPRDLNGVRWALGNVFKRIQPGVFGNLSMDTLPDTMLYFMLYYYTIYNACMIDPCPRYPSKSKQ